MKEGTVVIVSSGQAGTVIMLTGDSLTVLLRSGEVWTGPTKQCYVPQTPAELEAAPIEAARPEPKRKRSRDDD